jgi:pyruvate/2-oxoglutarate/acetoin dehydrogenase E1 component
MPTVLESLNQALYQAVAADPRVYLVGEDLLDPYGGAFKVTRGLSSAFPERVLSTPISEAGFTGLAAGMALRGLRPVVEIMFGDFLTLIADQVINHIAKFHWMYSGAKSPEEQVYTPLVIRTPMGGRRGYGPTHSQTLEKHFLGVPGLRVLAPCALGDPGGLLRQAILEDQDAVLFIENKLLYLLPVLGEDSPGEFDLHTHRPVGGTSQENGALATASYAPCYTLRVRGAPPPSLTLATYGYMAELARQASLRLAYEHEVFVELVVSTQLAPFQEGEILASARQSGRLITVEEGTHDLGWGAEIVARAAEALGPRLHAAGRVAAQNLPTPSSGPLEAAVLPTVEHIIESAKRLVKGQG